MATSGNISVSPSGVVLGVKTYTLSWSRASYSVEDNSSTINWTFTVNSNISGAYNYTYTITINGTSYTGSFTSVNKGDTTIRTGTLKIPHNTDGTKSFAYSFSVVRPNNGTVSQSGTATLDSIVRPATISTASNFADEDNPTITYSNPSGTAVTSLQACIANSTGNTIYVAYRDISKTGSSYTFNLTAAERATLRSAASTASTLTVRFYVKTVAGGETFYKFLTRTMTIDDAAPTVNPTVKDTNSTTIALTGNDSILIPGYSNAYYNIGATANKGATIQSQSATCGAIVKTTATGVFTAVPSHQFTFYCRDSRGSMVYQPYEADYVPYYKVTCNQSVHLNLDGTVDLNITGNYFSGSFGAQDNTLTVEIRHREAGGSWGAWGSITPLVSDISGGTYTLTAAITGFDPSGTYEFQSRATDKLITAYSGDSSITLSPIFDWSRTDFNFNVPVTMNGQTVLRHNETANNLVVSASGGFIYLRPGGTNDTTSEVLITPQGNIQLSGDIIINGKSLKSLLGIE